MNAGFSSLTALKAQLLAEALRQDTSYDTQITALGLGVAGAMEKFCNRKFYRTANDTVIFTADRESFTVPRYPLESIASIHLKTTDAEGWVQQSSTLIITSSATSGVVRFGANLGGETDLIKLTYTGGYYWDITEDDSGSQPSGSTALPGDILFAWILQCKKVWEVMDPVGMKIVPSKNAPQLVGLSLAGLELVPQVKDMLNGHIRYALD